MKTEAPVSQTKPLLRGHFHQAAFFFFLGACAMLIVKSKNLRSAEFAFIYSLSLVNLLGVSALYHRPNWSPRIRARMRKLDHAAIFILIAGTGTPLAGLGLSESEGSQLLVRIWAVAALGVLQSLAWPTMPKWASALFYVMAGWMLFPYLGALGATLSMRSLSFLFMGGLMYTIGALVYALKRPNPFPKYFGYHEIFHFLVVLAAIFHFFVISELVG